jgi:hypothetical protein
MPDPPHAKAATPSSEPVASAGERAGASWSSSSSSARDATPDGPRGLAWARHMLSHRDDGRLATLREFVDDDVDEDGVLTADEAFRWLRKLTSRVDLQLPRQERCDRLFQLCDRNGDG